MALFPLQGDTEIGKLIGFVAADGGFSVMFGNGDGTFQNGYLCYAAVLFLAVADVNNDGKPRHCAGMIRQSQHVSGVPGQWDGL